MAALDYGVPRTTLQDRCSGRVIHGTRPGPRSYLTDGEEKELHDYIVTVGEIGYGKTRKQIKDIAEKVAIEKGVRKRFQMGGSEGSKTDIPTYHFVKETPHVERDYQRLIIKKKSTRTLSC